MENFLRYSEFCGRRGPSKYFHFYLIIWYLAKIISTFQELTPYLKRIYMNYIAGDIDLVDVIEHKFHYHNMYL